MNGFWPNFYDTNPVNIKVFLDLLTKIFSTNIKLGSKNESEILFESYFGRSLLQEKEWDYTFFFSGEALSIPNIEKYDVVLGPFNNEKNLISFPLFLTNVYCGNFFHRLENINHFTTVPKKEICCIISNPNGKDRNYFLDQLEKEFKIDYLGSYRNNTFKIKANYNSDNFFTILKNYKFIVTMENTKQECYVTEKILHGFLSNNIPIYWGANNVNEYFNEERFINVTNMDNDTINKVILQIKNLSKNTEDYLKMVNKPILKNNEWMITLDDIANDVKKLIFYVKKY